MRPVLARAAAVIAVVSLAGCPDPKDLLCAGASDSDPQCEDGHLIEAPPEPGEVRFRPAAIGAGRVFVAQTGARGEELWQAPPEPGEVRFRPAAIGAGRVFVAQTGARGEELWQAPLDDSGVPTAPLAATGAARSQLAVWPGPDGGALATYRDADGAVAATLSADGRFGAPRRLAGASPVDVQAVFDGDGYVVAWYAAGDDELRLVATRVGAGGAIGAVRTVASFEPDDSVGPFALASGGAGDALVTWRVRAGGRVDSGAASEVRAARLVGGDVDGAAWTLAGDLAPGGCLGPSHALLFTDGGYRLLVTRGRCELGATSTVRDLRVDVATRSTVEQRSPLALAPLPRRWLPGPGGFLVFTDRPALVVDGALTNTALAWPTHQGESTVAGATASGFVAAFLVDDAAGAHVDVVVLGLGPVRRTRVATSFEVPPPADGCAVGARPAGLAPVLAALLALVLAFDRRRRRGGSGRDILSR